MFTGAANTEGNARQAQQTQGRAIILPSRGQVNYQAILREKGVHFSEGVEPAINNLVDSPMTAWNDMLSDNSSSSTETLQIITGDDDVAESSAQGAARALARSGQLNPDEEIPPTFMIARSVLINMQQPNIFINVMSLWGSALPPISTIKTFLSDKVSMYDNDREVNILGRRVARKLCFDASPADDNALISFEAPNVNQETMEPLVIASTPSIKRPRYARKELVQVTTAVRRSPRNNIYRGFKVDMPTDAKKRQSKVKNRVIPDVSGNSWLVSDSVATPAKYVPDSDGQSTSPTIPPPTPVSILQKIGVNICGIPPEELEKDKLEQSGSDDGA
jgi:hypothetical protein